jgi:GTPase
MQEVTGNLSGLRTAEIKLLERLYRRRISPTEVVSAELAQTMAELSARMHRQVGVLIDRRGAVAHVIVGDASKLMLPDVGRIRGGQGRFRGLRLVHTHIRGEALTRDDLTDLALLRFDLVAAFTVDATARIDRLYIAHLVADAPPERPWRELPAETIHKQITNAVELIAALEADYGKQHKGMAKVANPEKRALLVHVAVGRQRDTDARVAELQELCRTAGGARQIR